MKNNASQQLGLIEHCAAICGGVFRAATSRAAEEAAESPHRARTDRLADFSDCHAAQRTAQTLLNGVDVNPDGYNTNRDELIGDPHLAEPFGAGFLKAGPRRPAFSFCVKNHLLVHISAVRRAWVLPPVLDARWARREFPGSR